MERVYSIDDLVKQILNQNFSGTEEEIIIQQVVYLDKYIKEYINYDFDAALSGDGKNSAFHDEGFWNGLALCGSISSIASQVFDKLGIDNSFVLGKVDFPENGGHRWNLINIDGENYMIDFTLSLLNAKYDEDGYEQLNGIMEKSDNDYKYLFCGKEGLFPGIRDISIKKAIGKTSDGKTTIRTTYGDSALEVIANIHGKSFDEINRIISNSNKSVTDKREEDSISETFGVDSDKINHVFLSSGLEIFNFYSEELNREVLLRKEKDGKSLNEYLEEIQKNNSEYQTSDASRNAYDILMNERSNGGFELVIHTKEEITDLMVESISEDDLKKLRYLINNYEELNIKGINIENLIYLDNDGKIHEATLTKDNEVVVSTPQDKNSSSVEITDRENFHDEEDSFSEDDLAMTSFDIFGQDTNIQEEKPKQYVYKNNGFAHITLFIVVGILLLIFILFLLLK